MPIINCLETAKKAYKDTIDNDEIESTYDALKRYADTARNSGSNLYSELNKFVENNIRDRERALKAEQLQQLTSMQAVVDNLQYINAFKEVGHPDAVARALRAKMGGSPYKISRGRENTDSKMKHARTTFERRFANDIQEYAPIWNSQEGQSDLVQAMFDLDAGKDVNTPHGKLAKVVKKYQKQYVAGLRKLGIDVNELDDRVAPNIHAPEKILKLSKAERVQARASGQSDYEFSRERWKTDMIPLLDKAKTFALRGVNFFSKDEMNRFMDEAFDNIVNKGKVSQNQVNFANKVKKPRVFHWKDGQSLVKYNEKYGSGAIQDSIVRELSFGFGRLQMMKDWGVNPISTLERTLRLIDENPEYKARANKEKEFKKLRNTLSALTTHDADYPGTLATIGANARAWEAVTKLGQVVLSSIPDLTPVSREASRAGVPLFKSVPGVISKFVGGFSKREKEILSDFLDSGISNHIGQVARFYVEPYNPSKLAGQGVRLMHKLNLLGRWDNGNRGFIASSISRNLAKNRNIPWEKLPDSDKNILDLYNINSEDWNMIRQSATKADGKKLYITPDSVQDMDENILSESLKRQGVKNITPERIERYRDDIENKFRSYIMDRQDHGITNPDALDRETLTFGVPPEFEKTRAIIRIGTQFQAFGLGFVRRVIYPTLYGKGATNWREALFSAKADYMGIAKMTTSLMAFAYASDTLKNLAKGQSPASLDHAKTWADMLRASLGFYGMALQLDPDDFVASAGKAIAGPALSDVGKIVKLGKHALGDLFDGSNFDSTKRAWYGLAKDNIPFIKQAYTIWLLNNLLFQDWEDNAAPGKRQRDLNYLQQNEGVTQLY